MRRAVAITIALFTCATSGLIAQGAAKPESVIIQRVLVKVNGEAFTQKELEDQEIGFLRDSGKGDLQGDAMTKAIAEIMPDLLVNSIDQLLIVQKGRELGFTLSDALFKQQIENIKKDNKLDDAGLKAAMAQEGLTLDLLRVQLDKGYVTQMVKDREIMGRMTLTEEEARQYYEKHPDEFMQPASVMLREILIPVASAADPKAAPSMFAAPAASDESVKQQIIAIRERALKGDVFETLVAEVSQSASKPTGGLVGPIIVTEMATGIRDALDKMKPGEITQPIRTARGYQLFKLESRTISERLPFDKVRDEISQKVGEARLDVEMNKYLKTLRTTAFIDWKREDLRQMYEKRLAEREK